MSDIATLVDDLRRAGDEVDYLRDRLAVIEAKYGTDDPGKVESARAVLAEAEAFYNAARAALPPDVVDEAVGQLDALSKATARLDKIRAGLTALAPPAAAVNVGEGAGEAFNPTVTVKES